MSSLVEISTAFLSRLAGLQVVLDNQSVNVAVIPEVPLPEFLKKNYPVFSVSLFDTEPDYVRTDTEPDLFGLDAVNFTVYRKLLPEPFNLSYQIDCYSRFSQHTMAMVEHVLREMGRPEYLEVGTATLAADVAIGATSVPLVDASAYSFGQLLVLDRSTPDILRQQQAFFVLAVGSDGVVTVDPPVALPFPAASTACYKARFDLTYEFMLANDGQDGGRPYSRRTLQYQVWANLDLRTAEQLRTVGEVVLNWKPDWSLIQDLAAGSPYSLKG